MKAAACLIIGRTSEIHTYGHYARDNIHQNQPGNQPYNMFSSLNPKYKYMYIPIIIVPRLTVESVPYESSPVRSMVFDCDWLGPELDGFDGPATGGIPSNLANRRGLGDGSLNRLDLDVFLATLRTGLGDDGSLVLLGLDVFLGSVRFRVPSLRGMGGWLGSRLGGYHELAQQLGIGSYRRNSL